MKIRPLTLENLYIAILGFLVLLIVATPYLINRGISVLDEEILEVVTSAFLFVVGFLIYSLYKRDIARKQKSIDESLNYIGNINLQISHIKSIFNQMKKYPENKNDFKAAIKFLANKALGIVGVDWILFRIIEIESAKTLSEHFQARGKVTLVRYEVSNKSLVQYKACQGCSVVQSDQENFDMQAFCVLPTEKISEEQKIMLKAIVNNLAMIYLIFTSTHYENSLKNGNKNSKE
jgi:hypothetical protein